MLFRCVIIFTSIIAGSINPESIAKEASPQFDKDVLPLFEAKCMRCHGGKRIRADLDLRTLQSILKGGESGKVLVPGNAEKSLLFEKLHKGEMPPSERQRLKPDELKMIKNWIDALEVTSSVQITQHNIEPLMQLRCTACHGLRKQEAGLDLRTKASMLKGGKSGPAIVLGNPEESLLLKKIHSGAMPPRGQLIRAGVKPMRADEIEQLTQWIRSGAPEIVIKPDVATTKPDPLVTDEDRQFWSFQPPKKSPVPMLKSKRIRNPIDAFVLNELQEHGLSFSPEADRLTLLRRAYVDLIGLPPTPEEVTRFLNDKDPLAYEKLINKLLDSPRYGERWGRYWLDLVGYADSEGKRSADPIRPHAWRYRDYVIRSFNEDKPYSRFLQEQIAGDELADFRKVKKITPQIMDNLIATGFLRMAPDGTGSDIVNFVPERMEVISDQMQVFGSSVLGLTIQCARCHSHKYDPIPQRDYYRLLATFKGAYDQHDWLKPSFVKGQTKATTPGRVLTTVSEEAKREWEEYVERLKKEIAELKKQKNNRTATLTLRSLEPILKQQPSIRALWDRGDPSPTYVYRRGDYLQTGDLVGPGVLSVLTDGRSPFEVEKPYPGAKSTGRRLALAKWLTKSDHPLTARVMVNRIWKHHFGQGIVTSLSNFGKTGAKPSHPELLDWLAVEFVERGWSIKAMHRMMMTSSVYRQTSAVNDQHEKLDPANRYLSRMPLRRLEAESLRDSLIYVSGQLNETPFGPPDPVIARKDGLVTSIRGANGWRRSVYVRQRRSQIPTLLENFDLPQMNPNCVERVNSTVASQALHLMNNAMIEEIAGYFAERVRNEVGDNPKKQIARMYLLALSRPASKEEIAIGLSAIESFRARWESHLQGSKNKSRAEIQRRALASYGHVLLNSAAFVYVD